MPVHHISTSLSSLGNFLQPVGAAAGRAANGTVNLTNTVYDSEDGQDALYKGLTALTNVYHLVSSKATEPGQVKEAAKWMAPIGFMRECIEASQCFNCWRYVTNPAASDQADDMASGTSLSHDLKHWKGRWDDMLFSGVLWMDSHLALLSMAQRAEASFGSTNVLGWANGSAAGHTRSVLVVSAFAFDVARAGKEIVDIFNPKGEQKSTRECFTAVLKGPALRLAQRVAVICIVLNNEFGPSKLAGSSLATLTAIQAIDATCSLIRNYQASTSPSRAPVVKKEQVETLSPNAAWRTAQKISRCGSWFLKTSMNSGLRAREKALKVVDKSVALYQIANPDYKPEWANQLHGFTSAVSVWKNVFQGFADLRTLQGDVQALLNPNNRKMTLRKFSKNFTLWALGFMGGSIDGYLSLKKLDLLSLPSLTNQFGENSVMSQVGAKTGWNNWLAVGKDLSGLGLIASMLSSTKDIYDIWAPIDEDSTDEARGQRSVRDLSSNEVKLLSSFNTDELTQIRDLQKDNTRQWAEADTFDFFKGKEAAVPVINQLGDLSLLTDKVLKKMADENWSRVVQTAALTVGFGAKAFLVLAGPRIAKTTQWGPCALCAVSIVNAASGLFRSCYKDWLKQNRWDGVVGRVAAVAA